MKYTLMGFSQQGLINLGLDTIDAVILRYFIDFQGTNKMKSQQIQGKLFFWVNYDNVLKEFPILNLKKRTIQARFFKFRDAGVLAHYIKKEGGTYSFFGVGDKYKELTAVVPEVKEVKVINEDKKNVKVDVEVEKPKERLQTVEKECSESKEQMYKEQGESFTQEGSSLKGEGISLKRESSSLERDGSSLKHYPKQLKLLTNNPSTKNPSTINNITSPSGKVVYENSRKRVLQIIEYLNKARGKP